jgi:hypothetical protein
MDKMKSQKDIDADIEENGSFAKGCLIGSFICLPIWFLVYFFFKKWITD